MSCSKQTRDCSKWKDASRFELKVNRKFNWLNSFGVSFTGKSFSDVVLTLMYHVACAHIPLMLTHSYTVVAGKWIVILCLTLTELTKAKFMPCFWFNQQTCNFHIKSLPKSFLLVSCQPLRVRQTKNNCWSVCVITREFSHSHTINRHAHLCEHSNQASRYIW